MSKSRAVTDMGADATTYIEAALRRYRRDKKAYGEDVAGWNLYADTRALVDAKWREEYGGWDTRYRHVGTPVENAA